MSERVDRLDFYRNINPGQRFNKPRIKRVFVSNTVDKNQPPKEIPIFDYKSFKPHEYYDAINLVSKIMLNHGLSVKPAFALARSIVQNNFPPIETVSDLSYVSDDEFLGGVRGIGSKYLGEIRNIFPFTPSKP